MKKIILYSVFLFASVLSLAKEFKGAEVQSKKAFHYGKFETRFYSSSVSGMLSTFFLFENEGYLPCCKWQEIDVEVFGKGNGNSWQSNPIWQTSGSGDRLTSDQHHELENDGYVDEFHTYTVEWAPTFIKWRVDGKLIRTFEDQDALKIIGEKPMLAMFNIWTSHWTDWTGPFNGDEAPTYQLVDYLKVYDYVSDSTFEEKPSFVDEFDGDLSQWNVSTHSFEGNLCDFDRDNVELRDGNLILAFTKEGKQGIPKKLNLKGGIDIKSSDWTETKDYPYVLKDQLSNMYLYEGDKVVFYNEKGEYVDRKIIEYGAVDASELTSGWYYFTISSTPKILRKIQKE